MRRSQFELGPRLLAIASRVLRDEVLADTATDHARLPCRLAECGHVPAAIAIDIAPEPLRTAREAVASAGLGDRVDVREGDGFTPVQPGEAATGVVAGVGIDTCLHIVEAPVVRTFSRLVLAPHGDLRGWQRLRVGLSERGFRLVDELVALERERTYPIAVARAGRPGSLEAKQAWLGPVLARRRDEATQAWFRKEAARLERARADAGSAPGGTKAAEAMELPLAWLREWLRKPGTA